MRQTGTVSWHVRGEESGNGAVRGDDAVGVRYVVTGRSIPDDPGTERWLYDWCLDWIEEPTTEQVDIDRNASTDSVRIVIDTVLDEVGPLRVHRDQLTLLEGVLDEFHVDCRLSRQAKPDEPTWL